MTTTLLRIILLISCCFLSTHSYATDNKADQNIPQSTVMDNKRLDILIKRVGKEVSGSLGFWRFKIKEYPVLVITDEQANRMRIMSPVKQDKVDQLSNEEMLRMMQANFDSALDARYAFAKNTLWSAYIHPLNELSDRQFLEGLGQVVNLVTTYGTSYRSGLLMFQRGDSKGIIERELIDELLEKGLAI